MLLLHVKRLHFTMPQPTHEPIDAQNPANVEVAGRRTASRFGRWQREVAHCPTRTTCSRTRRRCACWGFRMRCRAAGRSYGAERARLCTACPLAACGRQAIFIRAGSMRRTAGGSGWSPTSLPCCCRFRACRSRLGRTVARLVRAAGRWCLDLAKSNLRLDWLYSAALQLE